MDVIWHDDEIMQLEFALRAVRVEDFHEELRRARSLQQRALVRGRSSDKESSASDGNEGRAGMTFGDGHDSRIARSDVHGLFGSELTAERRPIWNCSAAEAVQVGALFGMPEGIP